MVSARSTPRRSWPSTWPGADTEHLEELDSVGRNRIFNLGYYTWVEQQGCER